MKRETSTYTYQVLSIIMILYAAIKLWQHILRIPGFITSSRVYYPMSEYLINYRAGYVRRGFLGEVLLSLSSATGYDPRIFITLFCGVIGLVFLYVLIRICHKSGLPLCLLPLSICVGGSEFLRKDYPIMLLLIGILYCYNRMQNVNVKLLLVAVLSVLAINIHEMYAFIALPVIVALILFDKKLELSVFKRLLWCLPHLLAFALVCICKGDQQKADIIINSWNSVLPEISDSKIIAPVALGWTLDTCIHYAWDEIWLRYSFGIPGYIGRPIFFVVVLYFISNFVRFFHKDSEKKNAEHFKLWTILVIQFICYTPMSILCLSDSQRIFFFWIVSSLVIYALCGEKVMEIVSQLRLMPVFATANRWFNTILIPSRIVCIVLLFTIGVAEYRFDLTEAWSYNVLSTFYRFIAGLIH